MNNFEKYSLLKKANTFLSILLVLTVLISVPYVIRYNAAVAIAIFMALLSAFIMTIYIDERYLDSELEPLLKNMPNKALWILLSGNICKYAYKCPHYRDSSKGCTNRSFRFKSIDKSFCGTFRDFEGIEIIRSEVLRDVY